MRKGFTLIELLAIILVLGIISLIAVPRVNNILIEAKKNSFNTSIQNLTKVLEEQCSNELIDGKIINKIYKFTNGESNPIIEATGNIPDSGYAIVNDKCKVTFYNASDGDYYVNGNDQEIVITDDVTHSKYYKYGEEYYFVKMGNPESTTEENAYSKNLSFGDGSFAILDNNDLNKFYSYGFFSNSIDEESAKNIVKIFNDKIKGTDLEKVYPDGFDYYIDYNINMTFFISDLCPYYRASKTKFCDLNYYDFFSKEDLLECNAIHSTIE